MNPTAESYIHFTAENCRKACAESPEIVSREPELRGIMLDTLANAADSIERVLRFEAGI